MKSTWIVKMALRDIRPNLARLMFFLSAIIVGIAALVAIDSLKENLSNNIDAEAKSLLGADLAINTTLAPKDSALEIIKNAPATLSQELNFLSMARFSGDKGSRLCFVKAIDANFPIYGDFETAPTNAKRNLLKGDGVVIDKSLEIQFNIQIGDSLNLGNKTFKVIGIVTQAPGALGFASAFAPAVFLYLPAVYQTDLIQQGSRINYVFYLGENDLKNPLLENYFDGFEAQFTQWGLKIQTLAARKAQSGRIFANIADFLALSGFIALLLGALGVGSAARVYVNEKIKDTAILRCIGANPKDVVAIYLLQISSLGSLAAILGAIFGIAIQLNLPLLLQSVLPISFETEIVWSAIAKGIITGSVTALIFAAIPLLTLLEISPMQVLQEFNISTGNKAKIRNFALYSLGFLLFGLLASIQLSSWKSAMFLLGAVLVCLVLLNILGRLLLIGLQSLKNEQFPLFFKLGISNLSRPGNQTQTLLTTLGFAGALIFTMLFSRDLLLQQIAISNSDKEPNTILFDIRASQLPAANAFCDSSDFEIIQEVPIVPMRISQINNRTVYDIKKDSTLDVRISTLEREFRATYRDSLLENEAIVQGTLKPFQNGEVVNISLEENTAKSLNVELGDEIVFNVQGLPLKTIVGSLRSINFNRIQTNFTVVFPNGVLEQAPKSYVIVGRSDTKEKSAIFQRQMLAAFPNVSVIDLALIIKTLREVTQKIAYIIQFMSAFSILTGFIILSSALWNSKFQRLQESVLLRTLGAVKSILNGAMFAEFLMLSIISGLAAIALALLITFGLANFVLQIPFSIPWISLLLGLAIYSTLVIGLGMLMNRNVLNKSPKEILTNA